MINLNDFDLSKFDFSVLPPQLVGRLSFSLTSPTQPPLPPGRHRLGIAEERDTLLFVPEGLTPQSAAPLLVVFHGATGEGEGLLEAFALHAQREQFLLMAPQSMFRTWDLAMGGNGPDLARLDQALSAVAAHFAIDPRHFAFAGFSDGGSYALSIGLTNGRLVSHVIGLSAGFINLYVPQGWPPVMVTHGDADEQLPAEKHGRLHAEKLRQDGYRVDYVEFEGGHSLTPVIAERAVRFFLAPRDK